MSKDSEARTAITGDSTGFVRAMTAAQASLHMLGGTLTGMGGIMGSVGSVVQGFAGAGVMGAVSAAVNEVIEALGECLDTYRDFETALIDVTSASGLAGDELAQLTEDVQAAAQAAGVEFGVGATAAMRAMESLVKAGLEGEDAIMALEGALALAKIESISTAEASDMLIGVLGMFKLSAEEAAYATDVLVNASIQGIGTAAQFARGLAYVGGRAEALGFSLEETTAALVAMNNQGINATSAGQYLNMMFTSLITKSDKLGFSIYDASGEMLSLAEISGNLVSRLQEFETQEERNAYMTEVFGARAGIAANALMGLGDSGDEVTAILAAMTEELGTTGTAMGVVDAKTDTLAGSQARLDALMENLQLTVGEGLAPIMMVMADIMEDVLIPVMKEVLKPIMVWIARLSGLINFIVALGKIIAHYLAPIITRITQFLQPLVDALAEVQAAIEYVTGTIAGAVETMALDIEESSIDIVDAADLIDEAFEDVADSALDSFDVITEGIDDMADEVTSTWDTLVGDVNDQIQSGLLGEAQKGIHDFVNCSVNKQADMVEDIDGYMADIADQYKKNAARINDLLAQGRFEEANMLTRQNEELMKKMEQLMAWRTQLVDQTWADTTDTIKQSLIDQYSLWESYYGDVEDLITAPILPDPIIKPIDRLLDPIRGVDPIRSPRPDPIAPVLAAVNMEFSGDYTPQDARKLAEEIYQELENLEEEKLRQRWMHRHA